MSSPFEGHWWAARSGTQRSTAHLTLVHMVAPVGGGSLLATCGTVLATRQARLKLPGDHMCLRCCRQGAKALPPPEPVVEWLTPSCGDYNCGGCPNVIQVGARLAWAPNPGRHGVLLCESCAERIESGTHHE